jgi:hypothetical protein
LRISFKLKQTYPVKASIVKLKNRKVIKLVMISLI